MNHHLSLISVFFLWFLTWTQGFLINGTNGTNDFIPAENIRYLTATWHIIVVANGEVFSIYLVLYLQCAYSDRIFTHIITLMIT